MKLALVLTGLSRCWEQAYDSFKQNFLDRFETDVYIDIWSEKGYYSGVKGYLPEVNGFVQTVPGERGFHDSGELTNVNALMKIYKPKWVIVEDFATYEPIAEERKENFPNAYTRPKNTISQAYKIWHGMNALAHTDHGHAYDLVVRARPDIVIEHLIPKEWLTSNHFLTLCSRNKMGKGTGDSIQIANFNIMFHFSEMYNNLEDFYETTGVSCPHLFVEEQIKQTTQGTTVTWKEMNGIGAHVAHSPNGLYQEPE